MGFAALFVWLAVALLLILGGLIAVGSVAIAAERVVRWWDGRYVRRTVRAERAAHGAFPVVTKGKLNKSVKTRA